jgi:hypothetical protein
LTLIPSALSALPLSGVFLMGAVQKNTPGAIEVHTDLRMQQSDFAFGMKECWA